MEIILKIYILPFTIVKNILTLIVSIVLMYKNWSKIKYAATLFQLKLINQDQFLKEFFDIVLKNETALSFIEVSSKKSLKIIFSTSVYLPIIINNLK
jgi:hypothetical protein